MAGQNRNELPVDYPTNSGEKTEFGDDQCTTDYTASKKRGDRAPNKSRTKKNSAELITRKNSSSNSSTLELTFINYDPENEMG